MAYDETLAEDKDVVRMYLGDTGTSELVTDAHIEAVLTLAGSVAGAVVILARELLARFAAQPSSVRLPNGLSVSYARGGWESLISSGLSGTLGGTVGTLTGGVLTLDFATEGYSEA